mmetsp:Transcript_29844/g.97622  ORF Transcript_29844/g.97622 Transcript_29844/m.97622 type:complete len:261 (-) Transcript_29844:80-862(-)
MVRRTRSMRRTKWRIVALGASPSALNVNLSSPGNVATSHSSAFANVGKTLREQSAQHSPPLHLRPSSSGRSPIAVSSSMYAMLSANADAPVRSGLRHVMFVRVCDRSRRWRMSASKTWCSIRGTSPGSGSSAASAASTCPTSSTRRTRGGRRPRATRSRATSIGSASSRRSSTPSSRPSRPRPRSRCRRCTRAASSAASSGSSTLGAAPSRATPRRPRWTASSGNGKRSSSSAGARAAWARRRCRRLWAWPSRTGASTRW